jgi:hypothetical protein
VLPTLTSSAVTDRHDDPAHPYGGHRPDGTYALGPKGPICILALLIAYTYCTVSASTTDGQRKADVTYKGRRSQELRDEGLLDDPPRFAYVGRFTGPRKPATSGRKRKAA